MRYSSMLLLSLTIFWTAQPGVYAQTMDSTSFTGLWVLDTSEQVSRSLAKERNSMETLTENHREGLIETMKSRVYIFHEDGSFESSWVTGGDTRVVYGEWEMDKDEVLHIRLNNKSGFSYNIQLDPVHFILSPKVKSEEVIQPLYLKRIDR